MSDHFQQAWEAKHTDGTVVVRDLATLPIPHIQDATIKGFYTDPDQLDGELNAALALSDELIAELAEADEVIVSLPLYNFSIPSALKAWIDHVVRINQTFGMNEDGFYGLIKNTKLHLAISKGAVYANTQIESLDMAEPYLKLILPFLGLEFVDTFCVEGTTTDESAYAQSRQKALRQIDEYFAQVAGH